MENITSLMESAMAWNDRAMTYTVSRRLSELFPGQSVINVADEFQAEEFVRYGQSDAKLVTRLAHQELASWDFDANLLRRRLLTSWIEVEWSGERYQVVKAPRYKCGIFHWVVGPEPGISHFVRAVLAYSSKRRRTTYVYTSWWEESVALNSAIEQSRWDEMVLPPSMEQTLIMHTRGFFDAKDEFEQLGVPWKRGLLLTGPPGNGKTHAIRAILNTLAVPRLIVKSFGDDSDDVQEVFNKAREMAPCVLVLEDLDALISKTLLSPILNSLDGAQPLNGVLVIATTNHPEKLDPAIRNRPSRFDRVIKFGPPALAERRKLLARLLSRGPKEMRPTSRQITSLAEMTEGFSYAYLKELTLSAALIWTQEKKPGAIFGIAKRFVSELREQIASSSKSPAKDDEDADDS